MALHAELVAQILLAGDGVVGDFLGTFVDAKSKSIRINFLSHVLTSLLVFCSHYDNNVTSSMISMSLSLIHIYADNFVYLLKDIFNCIVSVYFS